LTGHTENHIAQICLPGRDHPTVYYCYTHRSSAPPGGPPRGSSIPVCDH